MKAGRPPCEQSTVYEPGASGIDPSVVIPHTGVAGSEI